MPVWKTLLPWAPAWLVAICLFAAILAAGLVLQSLVTRFMTERPAAWRPFLRHAWMRTRHLGRFMLVLFAAGVAVQTLSLSGEGLDTARKIFLCLFIIQTGWIAMVVANLAMDRYAQNLNLQASDNLLARKAATQMRIFRHAANVVLTALTAAFALPSPPERNLDAALDLVVFEVRIEAIEGRGEIVGRLDLDGPREAEALQLG